MPRRSVSLLPRSLARPAILLMVIPIALGLAVPTALADDWPQWRGPDRNGHADVFQVPATWPDAPEKVWKVEVGEGYASPVIVGDRIYIMARQGDDEVAMALELATGKTLWTSKFPTPYTPHQAAVKYGQGPKATPVYADGVVCFLGIDARFSCHAADSGKVLWVKDYSDKSSPQKTFCGSSMSPLVDGDTLYIHLGDDLAGRLIAADLRTGEEKWGYDGQGPGYASPFMLEIDGVRQFVTFATKDLLSFDPKTGELLWSRPYEDKWRENIVDPLVVGERILLTDYENGTISLWPKKTEKGWEVQNHWHNKELTQRMASPVTDGKLVYGFSDKRKGQLFVLDPESGTVLWKDEGRGGSNATFTLVGDYLVMINTDAEMRIYRRDGKSLDEVKRYEIADSEVWAYPAWMKSDVLIKDNTHLARLSFSTAAEKAGP